MPCFKRYKDVESLKFHETLIDENDGEGGWVDTQYYNEGKDDAEVTLGEEAREDVLISSKPSSSAKTTKSSATTNDDDDSEAEDIETYLGKDDDFGADDLNELNDQACPIDDELAAMNLKDKETTETSNIVSTRTYDLYITYDKYYQTPRLWLVGFDEFCKPLTIEQMYEDIR